MRDSLLHQKADEHFFAMVDAPMLSCGRELLMRDTEQVRQLLGVRDPEKRRESPHHEPCEGDAVALAKLVVQEGEKPGKFLWPQGMILLFWAFRIFMEDNPSGLQNQNPLEIMELSVKSATQGKRAGDATSTCTCSSPHQRVEILWVNNRAAAASHFRCY
jgi:hypothetical protein